MTALTIRLPNSVHETIKDLARRDGISVGSRKDFEKFLRKVPNLTPLPEDQRE